MAGADDRLTGDRPAEVPAVPYRPLPGPVDEQRRRRAEAAAEAAEAAAVEAAARASAAIAAASRAAAAAEAAADAAALAAAEVEAAVAAERAALALADVIIANETTVVDAMAPLPAAAANGVAAEGPGAADAVTEAIPVPVPVPAPGTADTPDDVARASRRRADEAAAAVAREATRDPETQVIPPEEARGPLGRLLRATRAQLDTRALLTAGAVGTVLVVAAVLAAVFGGTRFPAPPAAVGSAAVPSAAIPSAVAPSVAAPSVVAPSVVAQPAAPTSAAVSGAAGVSAAPATPTEARSDDPVDPTTPKAVAYLAALRAAGVPTSDSGQSETEAAAVICQQLAKGTAAADLVTALPAVLPSVNNRQAKSMVAVAQRAYC